MITWDKVAPCQFHFYADLSNYYEELSAENNIPFSPPPSPYLGPLALDLDLAGRCTGEEKEAEEESCDHGSQCPAISLTSRLSLPSSEGRTGKPR